MYSVRVRHQVGRWLPTCVEDGVLLLLLVPPSIKVVDEVTAEVVDGTMQRFERALANSRLLVAFARRWLSLVCSRGPGCRLAASLCFVSFALCAFQSRAGGSQKAIGNLVLFGLEFRMAVLCQSTCPLASHWLAPSR